jgi:TetR/AcrR family transcriptional regulator, fatty acid metabolism regulator protein
MEITDKRQLILQSAARIFGTKGFHDTKVEEIAEGAGVAKGTVYLYFKDKSNLLFEVSRYFMEIYLKEVRDDIARRETARDKLCAIARYHLKRFPDVARFHKINFEHLAKMNRDSCARDRIKGDMETALSLLEEIIRFGIDRGEFRPVSVTDTAMIIWGTLQSYIHFVISGVVGEKASPEADTLIDTVIQGIGQ